MENLTNQFQRILDSSTPDDLNILADFLENFEKKQQGEFNTYLSASLNMKRETSVEKSIISIPNTAFIHNNIAIPHGGILAVLLDTAMGTLANSKCADGMAAVTTNLTIHYLAVATENEIKAEAKMIRQGRHTMVVEGNIFESGGKHIATATGSFFLVPAEG